MPQFDHCIHLHIIQSLGSVLCVIWYKRSLVNATSATKVTSLLIAQHNPLLLCYDRYDFFIKITWLINHNMYSNYHCRDAILIPIINCFTSVYAGFAVFAVLGFIAQLKNVDVADVADEGKSTGACQSKKCTRLEFHYHIEAWTKLPFFRRHLKIHSFGWKFDSRFSKGPWCSSWQ